MFWRKEYLDVVLVPSGLFVLSGYHVYLLFRCIKHPETTVIGCENHCKKAWVKRMLQVDAKDRGLALTVINSTVTASTFLASTSLALSSLIGTWFGSSSRNILTSHLIYGDTSSTVISVKYISLLVCFLVSFASFLQCVRNFVHAGFLISMPNADIPVHCLQRAVIRGSAFWSVGLRAIYFATTLLLWIFGPIPMFAASLIMVMVLHILDTNSIPLQQFKPPKKHNLWSKNGEEITTLARVMEQEDRLHGREGKT